MGAEPRRLHVVAGIITDDAGRYLLTRRLPLAHQGGKWEFPGGKREPGESSEEALARELFEELQIELLGSEPFLSISHDYPDLSILLEVRRVTAYAGEPLPVEGQGLSWFDLQELYALEMPAANRAIARALRLPPLYLITPSPDLYQEIDFLDTLGRALNGGVRLVRLRAPGMDTARYRDVAGKVLASCRSHGASLLLDADHFVPDIGADGIHLSARRLMACAARPLPSDLWVAASCHDAHEMRHALSIGCDFVALSPVRATPSHPWAQALGWEAFAGLCRDSGLPIYALGGLDAGDIPAARTCGAVGIAAVRSLWS